MRRREIYPGLTIFTVPSMNFELIEQAVIVKYCDTEGRYEGPLS